MICWLWHQLLYKHFLIFLLALGDVSSVINPFYGWGKLRLREIKDLPRTTPINGRARLQVHNWQMPELTFSGLIFSASSGPWYQEEASVASL